MSRDPAFLFYDGDAARDVSHMNRIERGCYFDILQAQRKFGRLSEDTIKRVLGKEYDSCWESVKMCLTYEKHMYFINWVEESTNKRRNYCDGRKSNRQSRNAEHMSNICQTYVEHMENENENENEKEIVNKDIINKGTRQKSFIPPTIEQVAEYCIERKNTIDPQFFVDSGEKNGWVDKNGNKYKDWKAVIRTWEKMPWNKKEQEKRRML